MDKHIISNGFARFCISFFNCLYLVLILVLSIWTFLYRIEFTSPTGFAVFYIFLNIVFCALMILTKDQILTRIVSLSVLAPVFLLTVINLTRPVLFVPPLIVGILMFFICGAGDTSKVVLGSIYILLFIIGIVGYNIVSTLFSGSIIETRLDYNISDPEITAVYDMEKINRLVLNSVSPDGKYRYYILDVQDNDRGKVIIVVEPNDMDVKHRFFTLVEAGYTSRIAKYQARGITPDIEWIPNNEYTESSENARYKLRYRFGEGTEWKTSTINIPNKKNYLQFMNLN